MTEQQRIEKAREAIIGIFRAYEVETGCVISDEKYDHVRWLLSVAREAKEGQSNAKVLRC